MSANHPSEALPEEGSGGEELAIDRAALVEAFVAESAEVLAALEQGLPACAGVALGVDRLLMALLGTPRIADVLAFDFARG